MKITSTSFKKKVLISAGISALAFGFVTETNAQTATKAKSSETIIVTGSSIKRKVLDSASPMQIYSTEDLKRESISSTEQFVMLLNSNGTGLDNLASNADVVSGQARGNNGASSANLRGQGSAGTLVLLNGRRVAAHGLNGGAVDINQIPMSAIERVDVFKDGASAIYGTDAIGGVINFITKKNIKGLTLDTFVDVTEQGGGNIYSSALTGGFGDLDTQHFNLMGTISHRENQILNGSDRDFVNTFQVNKGLSVDTRGTPVATIFPLAGTMFTTANTPFIPGTTIRATGGINPLDLSNGAGCSTVDGMAPYDEKLWDTPSAALACAWDTGRAAVIQQPLKTTTYLGRGVYRIGEHEIVAELTGSDATAHKQFSNLQISPNTTTQNFALPSTSPYYNSIYNQLVAVFPEIAARKGQSISFRWRCMPCERREIVTDTKTSRSFIGADGPLGETEWQYRTGYSFATSQSKSTLGNGYFYRNSSSALGVVGLIDVLNSGVINPFSTEGTQSQAAMDAIKSASAKGVVLYGGKYTVSDFDGSVSGPMFNLPGGRSYAAIGFEKRVESYRFNGDARAANARPVILGAPFDDSNALSGVSRNIDAIYAEFALPLFKGFELGLAARLDDYSGFGTTTNPRVTFKYRPWQPLLLRGSYNTGFRVPSFNQIFNGVTESPYAGKDLVDPAKCPTLKVDTAKAGCESITPTILTGGKSDLGPETAKQHSLGFVYEPARGYSISLDWWKVDRTGTIQTLTLTQLISNYSLFGDNFLRDASGNLLAIDDRWVNAGQSLTQGLELGLRGRGQIGGFKWSAGLDGTKMLEKKSRIIQSAAFSPSELGVFTFNGDLGLKWKHNAYISFDKGVWAFSFSQIYRSGYTNQELPGVTSGKISPPDLEKEVKPYITYNVSTTFKGFKNFTITGGIKNLLNTDPPFAITYDSNTGAGSSWEPRVADPRGRAYTLALQYKF